MADLDPVVASILLVWLIFFGACVGSFLNVVVYRLPLGKSLSDPPSHCPKCGHPIRWFDNVPVLGWIWLRGRCRDCREPISVRYPIVEFVGGAVFGSIAWLTLQRGGDASLSEFFFFVLGLSSLVLTFFAAGLIERDGEEVPWRLFLPVIVLGPMMPWLVQESMHLNLFADMHVPVRYWNGTVFVYTIFESVNFGLIISLIYACLTRMEQDTFCWCLASALIGVYLGIFGPVVVLLSALLLFVLWFFWSSVFWSHFLALAAMALIGILFFLTFAPASAPLG